MNTADNLINKHFAKSVSLAIGVTLAIFVLIYLYGCSPVTFQNAGSANTFEQDKYDCTVILGYRGHAGRTQPTDQLADYIVRGQSEMRACLERKGWKAIEG